ncbi:MAG TPA: squalene synthase HpnC [Streptosporangiaceae bacterium]|nr:squalene synthase HpnC [Streptosporangiaceae bacterium]
MTGESRSTGSAERTSVREHVRPSQTHAEEVVANAPGENFPVALRLLPARRRRHLTNLYFFARLTDDLGDEARDAEADVTALRLRLLDELAADVDRIYSGGSPKIPQSPVMRAMAETVRECGVPAQPLLDLIEANRQDQRVTRYPAYADLERYCELSANPVGQIVLYIFGVATAERIALSDNICTALQLAEHWQDVAEDLGNGRIYLPGEDLERFGCTEADLAAPAANEVVRQLMIFETDRASRLLDQGAPLVGTLHGAARLAVAGYLAGGRAALAAIRRQRYDVLTGTPRGRKPRLAAELVMAYLRGR